MDWKTHTKEIYKIKYTYCHYLHHRSCQHIAFLHQWRRQYLHLHPLPQGYSLGESLLRETLVGESLLEESALGESALEESVGESLDSLGVVVCSGLLGLGLTWGLFGEGLIWVLFAVGGLLIGVLDLLLGGMEEEDNGRWTVLLGALHICCRSRLTWCESSTISTAFDSIFCIVAATSAP